MDSFLQNFLFKHVVGIEQFAELIVSLRVLCTLLAIYVAIDASALANIVLLALTSIYIFVYFSRYRFDIIVCVIDF
jgi:hypothetical protein